MIFSHKHALEAVAVDTRAIVFNPVSTVILWRCTGCTHVESTTIDGRWTLAQVRGEPEPVPAGAVAAALLGT